MTLASGTRVGPYEILSPLGAGGMGEVYRAHDTRLKREVAIKVLPPSFSADPDRLRRFELEAEAAGRLNHPNILAIYDVGTHDGAPYVVSELLEGETLRDLLAGGPLSPRRALEYARGIASGLAAAHEKGIVHRDLKPENVFVTSDNRVKILDFGLAKLTQRESSAAGQSALTTSPGTEPGVVMGTVGYMSPEQVRGGTVDHRSDLFSFGAILFEMFSGRRAFQGDSSVETMNAILKEEPPELAGTGRSVPPGIDRIVRHALEKSPALRFQSARDLAFDLESLSETSVPVVPAVVHRRTRIWRYVLPAATLIVLGAATLAYIAGRVARTSTLPTFQRLTFRVGSVYTARFAPDGQAILYSGAWEGRPFQIHSTLPGSTESRSLGLSPALVAAISRNGEMAVLLSPAGPKLLGTLARVPLAGGAPRPVLDGVHSAAWAPDGETLAVTVDSGAGGDRIEYPIGKTIYETAGFIYDMRLSPDGNRIAIEETRAQTLQGGTGWIGLIDRSGKRTTLHEGWVRNCGVGWLPGGREIVFAVPDSSGSYRELYAGSISGKRRLLTRVAGPITMHDVSRDGRLLFTRDEVRILTMGGFRNGGGGEERSERPVSWLDESMAADLSPDGRHVLLSEVGSGGGAKGAVYLRPTDGTDAIRLGDGQALALSPDKKWALAATSEPSQLVLLPTGVGQPRVLPGSGFERYRFGRFLPDGKAIFFNANLRGRPNHCYVLDLGGGAPRPIGPEGGSCWAASPDGRSLAVTDSSRALRLYPVDGTTPLRPVAGWTREATPLQWSADGRALYVTTETEVPLSIRKFDFRTGRSDLVKQLVPPDATGVLSIASPLVTPDGRAYTYTYIRLLGDLYVADGIQ